MQQFLFLITLLVLLATHLLARVSPLGSQWLSDNTRVEIRELIHSAGEYRFPDRIPLSIHCLDRDEAGVLSARRGDGSSGSTGIHDRALEAKLRLRGSAVSFTENRGQVADTEGRPRPDVWYTAKAGGALLYFTQSGVSTVFCEANPAEQRVSEATATAAQQERYCDSRPAGTSAFRMDMFFEGANPNVRIRAEDNLPGYSHYYYPHCPGGITFVRSYGRIVYSDLYENIDLVYSCARQQIKYEFVVRPGGDVSDIRLRYGGMTDISLDSDGGLRVVTPSGSLKEDAPYSYQDGDAIKSSFRLDRATVGFHVGEYDKDRTLVIDPWATYCGSQQDDIFYDCSSDGNGNIYCAGGTRSQGFPVLSGWQMTLAGAEDFVIVKYDVSGVMQWSTFYGGSAVDGWTYMGIATDAAGNSVIGSQTESADFPVSPGAFQSIKSTYSDACAFKLSAAGVREWATFCGGSNADRFHNTGLDSNGNAIMVGSSNSTDYPVQGAQQSTYAGWGDGVISKFSSSGQLVWSTYFGGPSGWEYIWDVAILSDDRFAISMYTNNSADFPLVNAHQGSYGGGLQDAALALLTSTGSTVWSSYFGGSDGEYAYGICRDASNNIILAGNSYSSNFPVYNGFQMYKAGEWDVFVAKFSPSGARIWCTFFGGGAFENCSAVKAGANNELYLSGVTKSSNFPVLNAYQNTHAGGEDDAFCASISENCTLLWATYFGGSGRDVARGISVCQNGELALCGQTTSTNLPVLNAQQSVYMGGGSLGSDPGDGFVATFTNTGFYPITLSALRALYQDSRIIVEWTTESENNNAGFLVERRTDPGGAAWEQRGFVAGSGTSATRRVYSFADDPPGEFPPGAEFVYRLRQVDTDGRESISPEVSVFVGIRGPGFEIESLYPQPVGAEVRVSVRLPQEDDIELSLYDHLGRSLRRVRARHLSAGRHEFAFDLAGLPAGVYTLSAHNATHVATRRIMRAGN